MCDSQAFRLLLLSIVLHFAFGHNGFGKPGNTSAVPDALLTPPASTELDFEAIHDGPRGHGIKSDIYKYSSTVTVAAHLAGYRNYDQGLTDDVIRWNASSIQSYMKGGMQYRNGCLRVPVTGYYIIYSQVSFAISGVLSPHVLEHAAFVKSNPVLLEEPPARLTSKKTELDTKQLTPTKKYSFLLGRFIIEVGGMIFIAVSNPELLTSPENDNYFGVVLEQKIHYSTDI